MRIVARCIPLFIAFPALANARQASQQYELLDNTPAHVTNLNVETIRGTIVRERPNFPFFRLYALNTHGSTLNVFQTLNETPLRVWNMPLNPVSMAWYDDEPEDALDDRILVVCQGTHVLVSVDPKPNFNEGIYDLVQLPSEPADIVVDQATKKAYVSCMGTDQVVEVDLESMSISRTFDLDVKRPAFLSLDGGKVYVAPMMSGNNSSVVQFSPGTDFIVDLDNSPEADQRDFDLIQIDPATGSVDPVLRGMGTLLFDHGRNPVTGKYWMLNIDALNKDPNKQSEPAINGDFAANQLTLASLPTGAGSLPFETKINLDDLDNDPSSDPRLYDAARSGSSPWGLTFTESGNAWIAASTSDRIIAVHGDTGARLGEITLPQGSIPRQIVLSPFYEIPALRFVFVYAWGLNKVYAVYAGPDQSGLSFGDIFQEFDLGLDPTPADVVRGRNLFYDADFSKGSRFTCGTCHPGGMSDGIAWNLSGLPKDNKGPLVTQTLRGIEEMFPYHWRGERDLSDFNAAFVELLGGSRELDASEFSDFERFVFSLRTPANPNQSLRRKLEDKGSPDLMPSGLVGAARQGQQDFLHAQTTIGDNLSCVECHTLPTGTNSDIVPESLGPFPSRTNFDVTGLYNGNLSFKQFERDSSNFPQATVNLAPGVDQTINVSPLGVGILHDGQERTLFEFIDQQFGLTPQQAANIVAYLEQFDTGMSAAAHAGFLMTAANAANIRTEVQDILIPQARETVPWLDIAVFPADHSGPKWIYSKGPFGQFRFRPDTNNSAVPTRTLDDFVTDVQSGGPDYLFIGLPPGNGRRFAVDFDYDGLLNTDEATFSSTPFAEYESDQDGDDWPDGYEVFHGSLPLDSGSTPTDSAAPIITEAPRLIWEASRNAKITFRTNEPTTARVEFTSTADGTRIATRDEPSLIHTVVLQDLLQSTDNQTIQLQHSYQVDVVVTDLSGNTATAALDENIDTDKGCLADVNRIGDLTWVTVGKATSAGVAIAQAAVRIDGVEGVPNANPAADRAIFAQVMVKRAQSSTIEVLNDVEDTSVPVRPLGFSLALNGPAIPYSIVDGHFAPSVDLSCFLDPGHPDCDNDRILISDISGTDGMVDINFRASGLSIGDEVTLRILGVVPIDPTNPVQNLWPGMTGFTPPAFVQGLGSLSFYSLPDTPKQFRELTFIF